MVDIKSRRGLVAALTFCLSAIVGLVVATASATADVSSPKSSHGHTTISWSKVEGAVSYELTIRNHFGDTVFTKRTTRTSMKVPLGPGLYFIQVAAFNLFHKQASHSPWRQIRVYHTVAPQPTSVEPAILYQNTGSQELVVSGRNFLPGVRCEIMRGKKIAGRAVIEEAVPAGLRLRVDTSSLPAGSYHLRFVNPGGSPATRQLPLSLRIRTQPVLRGVSRSEGYNDETYRNVMVTGTGFVKGTRVALEGSGAKINAQGVVVKSHGRLVANFDLAGARPGEYELVATNPGGLSARLHHSFTVIEISTPHFASLTPSIVTAGESRYRFTIKGAGFVPATTILLKKGDALEPASLSSKPSSTKAQVTIAGNALGPGTYDLLIENGLALQTLVQNALVVRSLPHTELYSLSVRSGTDQQLLRGVRLAGKNLRPNETFYLQNGAARIRIEPKSVTSSRAVFDLNLRRIPDGTYEVAVYDKGRRVGSLPNGFTVNPDSFLTVEAGWPYTILSPTGVRTEFGNSADGADIVVGLNLGNRFLKRVPVVRKLGLELDTGYLQLSDTSNNNAGTLTTWRLGTNVFYKTAFNFPVNLVVRAGWGLAFSSFGKNTSIASTTGGSTDLYVKAGAGAQLLLFHLIPIEVGADWQRLLYAGANLDTIQFYARSGIALGF